jgi:hypothetical protein
MSSLAMSKEEREKFLAETHVAVVSIADGTRGPLSVPVWYRYEPGGKLSFVTGGSSRKAKLIRTAGRIGVCVQTETPPYKYVSIEGPATVGTPNYERDVRQTAFRYLGQQMGEMYLAATASEQTESVLISVRPERWYSVDYTRFGG